MMPLDKSGELAAADAVEALGAQDNENEEKTEGKVKNHLAVEKVEPVELGWRGLECLSGPGFGLGLDEGTDFAVVALPANDMGNFPLGVISEDFAAPSTDDFHEEDTAKRIGFPVVRWNVSRLVARRRDAGGETGRQQSWLEAAMGSLLRFREEESCNSSPATGTFPVAAAIGQ